MGLPLWKPKDIESDNDKEESFKHQQQLQQEAEDEESWSHRIVHDNVYNHHINNNNNNNNNTRRNNSSRHTVNNNNNNNTHSNNRHLSPVSSSIPIVANSSSLRRSRIARRHSMLTSSLMDRRRSSRVHQLPGTSSSSPPVRSELDRRLQQRILEKEDLLEQLQVTVSLLDQFLSARSALGSDLMTLPSFITEDLPAVLESAASLAAMAPTVLSSALQQNHNMNEVTTLSEMVDRLLQIPPYSTRIHNVESNIITAHRRIREQLGLLGTTNIPLPIRPSNNTIDTRPSFINFLEAHSSSISRS